MPQRDKFLIVHHDPAIGLNFSALTETTFDRQRIGDKMRITVSRSDDLFSELYLNKEKVAVFAFENEVEDNAAVDYLGTITIETGEKASDHFNALEGNVSLRQGFWRHLCIAANGTGLFTN